MTWWILTSQRHFPSPTSLAIYAITNHADHLFASWATWKPRRHPIYRVIRGTERLCGYRYIWDTPNIAEQSQSGDTLAHTFHLADLTPGSTIWFYLWAPDGPYGLEIQGPLSWVTLPEISMPSACLFHSLNQEIPDHVSTDVLFDSALWDDGGFWQPGLLPNKLSIPVSGLYHIGLAIRYTPFDEHGVRFWIQLSTGHLLARHSHHIGAIAWDGTEFTMSRIWPFQAGEWAKVLTYHNGVGNRLIPTESFSSPHFWIVYLGPSP